MYLQKVRSKKIIKKTFFDVVMMVTDKKSRIQSQTVIKRYGSVDQDPDSYQNVTDLEHRFLDPH
jgi:hypothetical protein